MARSTIDDLLEADPIRATGLGDHRFDNLLPSWDSAAIDEIVVRLEDHMTRLDAVDDVALPRDEHVDLEILRARVAARHFDLSEVRRHRWDPLIWDPGTAIRQLVVRDFAPADERLASVVARLQAVPGYLAEARSTLTDMSALHVETALARSAGFAGVVDEAAQLAGAAPPREFAEAAETAVEAVSTHAAWLADRLPDSRWDPRLGVRLYSAALWHHLDEELTPVQVLERAEAHLDEVNAQLRETAGEFLRESIRSPDIVRRALARIADDAPVTDTGVLPEVRGALDRLTSFVRQRDLVTIPAGETAIIEMPEIHRGVAVAYCDAPGPLERADVPTYVAVAPTPADWSLDRVTSFYREYNGVLLHDLTAHEAMPGHVLQLAHARSIRDTSLVRSFGMSGVFVEGWAVYAEHLVWERGYTPDDRPDAALRLRLQQLKMQARMTLNAILDARVHGGDIDEPAAIELLMRRGFQEESEAVGKWRRALLTAAQLPTYFVGWMGVRSIVDDLRVLHPTWSDREIHDLVLSHGSPGPRHLRALLGL
ncbi:MAG: hypothetical protein B7C55_08880 [Actinomycetales bacterium mxb001]|nr:MAG: hypothetical protein B7C55_08880 [Actinomycetales bacterium mxb001]